MKNVNQWIEDAVKSAGTKTYATMERAVSSAEKESQRLASCYGKTEGCRFIIVTLDSGRFTPLFLMIEWQQSVLKTGMYLGHFAQRGFCSI